MNENAQTQTPRQRPRWARVVHNFGDDLRWAISAWCDFPRPARRLTAAIFATAAAHTFGATEAVVSIISVVAG